MPLPFLEIPFHLFFLRAWPPHCPSTDQKQTSKSLPWLSDIPNLEYPPSVLWEQPAFILTELITLKVESTFPPLEFMQACDYGGSVTTSLVKLGHKTSFSLLLLGYKFLNIATPSYNEAQAIHRQIHKDVNRAQLGFQPAACKLPVMWMNHLGSAS